MWIGGLLLFDSMEVCFPSSFLHLVLLSLCPGEDEQVEVVGSTGWASPVREWLFILYLFLVDNYLSQIDSSWHKRLWCTNLGYHHLNAFINYEEDNAPVHTCMCTHNAHTHISAFIHTYTYICMQFDFPELTWAKFPKDHKERAILVNTTYFLLHLFLFESLECQAIFIFFWNLQILIGGFGSNHYWLLRVCIFPKCGHSLQQLSTNSLHLNGCVWY